ncbi:four-helix bundle copper-binding protein [Tellurirhabdus rosea]|uniref:four-helix bundle copper-binding protein n=1 Tax=Tellurirhabdus rosea TaxID=2674997 RepID=UPI00225BD70C|nr:four-helix bundle copper-binding protein [Tellurirhabdus rosea]
MIWKKNIYDTLVGCATVCDEYATECSRRSDIEDMYRCIFLSLDCADICRQMAMLYVRGSENTRLLAKTCIEICEKCAQECESLASERGCQIAGTCRQCIRTCLNILDMTTKPESDTAFSRSLFEALGRQEMIYN